MGIVSKLKTAGWYIARPKYYGELFALIKQRVFGTEKENTAKQSVEWCKSIAIDTPSALRKITGQLPSVTVEEEFAEIFAEAKKRQDSAPVKMGGAGNLDLLYHLCEHVQAKEVIETGVAYGWSTLATLLSLNKRNGSLNSVDMPYAKMGNDDYVGVVVPDNLRKNWNLIRFPDRKGLDIALNNTRTLDLCHYDSDKSYAGRMFAYPKLWSALRSGGIFISDDIQDNIGFHDYCKANNFTPIVVGHHDKYIGVLIKP
jgi:predicted O-methyltransferase YrrM